MNITELTGIDVPRAPHRRTVVQGARTFPVFDPANEETLAEVADGTVSDALDAASAAERRAPDGRLRRRGSGPRCCARLRAHDRADEEFARLMSARTARR